MGSDLAQIYARVVAVRPDLAVEGLLFERFFWTHPGAETRNINDGIASALITVKWLGALPVGHVLAPGGEFEGKSWWSIMVKQPDMTWLRHDRDGPEPAGFYTSMIEALAEFHAPGSTKGPNDER